MSLPIRATCTVPGSTSNCGSGFDTLGLALAIYNTVSVERCEAEQDGSFGPDILDESDMAKATARRFFEVSGVAPFAFRVRVKGDVPRARGLGSSVTVRGGLVAGLAALAGLDWSKQQVAELVTELEGHPDNATASILGGFTVSKFLESPAKLESAAKYEIAPSLRFVVVSPDFEVLTSDSRGILPTELSLSDAVTSINSVACVVAALASGRYAYLQDSVHDRIHEPYRLAKIPGAAAAIAAGCATGAYTGWLSGSGSSVLCACAADVAQPVANAMQKAFGAVGLSSEIYDLSADNDGLKVATSQS